MELINMDPATCAHEQTGWEVTGNGDNTHHATETCLLCNSVIEEKDGPCTDGDGDNMCDNCKGEICPHSSISTETVSNQDNTHTSKETCENCGEVINETVIDCDDENSDNICDVCNSAMVAEEVTAETGTETWISQPSPVTGLSNGVFWGGLAVLVLIIAAVLFRKKRAENGQESTDETRVNTNTEAPAMVTGSGVAVGSYQHIGAREDQQDSYGISNPSAYATNGVMAVVADGMGGLDNGKLVSSILVQVFVNGIRMAHPQAENADILLDLAIRANAQVNQALRGAKQSGSTLVATLIRDGMLNFLSVGDSRIYLWRNGGLMQLNREHIYQEDLARKAVNQQISLANVHTDRQAHALSSYFGIGQLPAIDRNDAGIRLLKGDRILLMSDGIFGTITDREIEQAMVGSVDEAANRLGNMVKNKNKPHQDNNTVVILEYQTNS